MSNTNTTTTTTNDPPKLAASLTNMKFMQNRKEAEYRNELQKQLEEKIKDSHWVVKGSFDGVTLNTGSESEVIGYKSVGRMSFGNFNSNIESLNTEKKKEVNSLHDQLIQRNNNTEDNNSKSNSNNSKQTPIDYSSSRSKSIFSSINVDDRAKQIVKDIVNQEEIKIKEEVSNNINNKKNNNNNKRKIDNLKQEKIEEDKNSNDKSKQVKKKFKNSK
ncbi:hypothetical protein DLAC_11834 [Tieghemostelium lacteum]|uniref:Uncharacterized protein n=1 Tax=Tieghemostelium lacteum TaxID=361077 RepID=A0A151Z363_TIELA|nr:hypothetical protein DLAC_11834 [Tieghemostelium lacteum]|eukprot:KYQ88254.1 hypothetical protein DLAC_11834 [Tieghemostelium lacteum]